MPNLDRAIDSPPLNLCKLGINGGLGLAIKNKIVAADSDRLSVHQSQNADDDQINRHEIIQ
jgi:hypothetical protein